MVYWWYYYPPVYYPMLYYDPMAMMSYMMQWMTIPYYYAMYMEMFRAMVDAWRKAVESMTTGLVQVQK